LFPELGHGSAKRKEDFMIRRLVERLSRGVVIKRRLPSSVGGLPLYVSPDAQLKYLKLGSNAFDPGLLRLATDQVLPDSVVWDVGANVGVFTFAAAGIASAGQVIAIEADPWLAALLRRTSALPEYGSRRVNILSAALSDKNGVSEFVIAQRGRASNYLANAGGWTQTGGIRERFHVATLTIDTLLDQFPPPTFVKIDVEGAEVMVLRGASKLLREVKPTLYVEVGSKNFDAVTQLLHSFEYLLYDSTKPLRNQTALSCCVADTLAVPQKN
jgi:FkbM family methyltransferase